MPFPNTSGNECWGTPLSLFDALDERYAFQLDAAADETNHKCPLWLGPGGLTHDALSMPHWGGLGPVWVNPPYSKRNGGILPWLSKARDTGLAGDLCVVLVFARTDTRAWQNVVHPSASDIYLIGGRVSFTPPQEYQGTATTAGAPSAVVVFTAAPNERGARYHTMARP